MRPMVKRGQVLIALGVALTLAGASAAGAYRAQQARRAAALARRQAGWDQVRARLQDHIAAFPGRVGLVVTDLRTGWTFTHDPNRQFASASLAKLPILIVCLEAVAEGRLRLTERLQVDAADRVGGSGILQSRPAGSEITVEEALGLMISHSDNTATNLIIERMGLSQLHEAFATEGWPGTTLARTMLDFQARAQGRENLTTAADIAQAMERIYRGRAGSPVLSRKAMTWLTNQRYRDRIPGRLPKGTVVANKTGLERHVCHDVGIVFTPQGDYLICALVRHRSSTSKGTKALIARVSRDVYDYMTGL